MDFFEVSQQQKKLCRQLIDTALQRECSTFIKKLSHASSTVANKDNTPLDHYHRLYKMMASFDKHLGTTYDNLGGSRYLQTVCMLYDKDILTDEDLSILDKETIDKISTLLSLRNL